MANSEAVSGVRRQLLNRQRISAQRGIKEPTRPERYRRGKVSNSGANLQAPRPDPTAGIEETANAKLIEQMQNFVFGKGMGFDQYKEAEKERGIASWQKADKATRDGYKEAISKGWMKSKESPFFRQAVTEAFTDSLTHKASIKLFTEYEKWPDRNDPSSGKLDEFFQQQEDEISAQMESIPDQTLRDKFYEHWQIQKRELTRRHGNHLNKQYEDQSKDAIGNKFYTMFEQYDQILGDTFKNSNLSLNQIVDNEKLTEKDYQDIAEIMSTVKDNGTLPDSKMKELEKNAFLNGEDSLWGRLYNGISSKKLPENISHTWAEPPRNVDYIANISKEEVDVVASTLTSEGNKTFINSSPEQKEKKVKRFLDSTIKSSGGRGSTKHPIIENDTFQSIIATSKEKKTTDEKEVVNLKSEEMGIKLAEALKNGTKKDITKIIKGDKNTVVLKGIIGEGGGAYSTLPKFLALSDKYSNTEKRFAENFKTLPIEQQRKLFVSYLEDNYTGGKKSLGNIWNPKTSKIVGNWKQAEFNFIHFKAYVENKT